MSTSTNHPAPGDAAGPAPSARLTSPTDGAGKLRKHGGRSPELGERSREELAAMFGQMYAGWDSGVNMEGPDTGFRETPMTPMELEARYVAAEIGANIFEIAGMAAFAPIIVYDLIRKYLGPLYASHFQTMGELVEKTDVLRALALQIGGMPNSDARTRALNLIEDTLHKDRAEAS